MPAIQNNRSYRDHPARVKVTVSLCHCVTVQEGPSSPTVRSSEKVVLDGSLPKVEMLLGDIKHVGKATSVGNEAERSTGSL